MLQSCSSSDSNTTNNPLLKGKLKRTHTVSSNGQNSYSNFFYDVDGQLIKGTAGNESGSIIVESYVFTRNSNGKIVNVLFNDYNSPQQINYAYTLDSNQNYLTCLITYTPSTTNNSTGEVYVYSGNKISQINHSDGEKVKYTYDSNENVIKVDKSIENGSWITDANYTYDNKVNPFQLEGLIVGRFISCGNNNITSVTMVNQPISYSRNYKYNYNSNNKPSTCISTGTTSPGSTEYFYY